VPADFGLLGIDKVIVHAIPRMSKRDTDPAPLRLSEVVSPLDETVRTQLQSRLRGDLHSGSTDVVQDPESEGRVPKLIGDYLRGEEDFVRASRELAKELRECQNGSNPDGMLLVADCTFSQSRALLIVKLEHQDGVQASFLETDGLKTFDVQTVRDLMYTSKSRVYKIGLFSQQGLTAHGISGVVADKQSSGGQAAQFFLKYLGCQTRQDPSETTRQFYERATTWINTNLADLGKRADYTVALHAELKSQAAQINPRGFVRTHIDEGHRDDFLNCVCQEDVPRGGFPKDIERIEKVLSNIQFHFVSGISAVVPNSALDDGTASIESTETGRSRLIIEDEITQVKGKGASGRRPKQVESKQEEQGDPEIETN
jgi:hypothetical protein